MVRLTSRETLTKVFDGVDPYTLSLSNDAQTVSTAADGTGGSYADAVTEVTVYRGTAVDTPAWTITAQASTGVTGTLTGAVYRVTALSVDQGKVTFTATNKTDSTKTLTKVFTISKSKRGESNVSYGVSANRRVLKKYKDRLIKGQDGSPSIDRGITFDFNDLTIKATKKTGSTEEPFSGYIEITEEVVSTTGSTATIKYFSSTPESAKTYAFTKSDLVRIKVKLYRTSDKSELLDTEYIDVLMDGQSAITIVNTNPTVVLPSDYKGVVSDYSAATGQIFVYDGDTDVTSLCTFSLLEPDSLFQVTPEGEFSLPTMSSLLDIYSGSIVVGYKDMNFTNNVTVTKGKSGKDGSSAKLLYLTSDSLIFNLDFNGEPKSGPITVQALFQNIEGDATFEVIGVTSTGNEEPILVSPISNEIVLPASLGKSYIRIRVTASLGTLTDTITISALRDASPTISAQLSNENVTLPATNAGVVTTSSYASASGNFKVYEGSTDVTSLCTFSLTQVSGVNASITSTGAYSVTAIHDTLDSVALVFTATYKGKQYSRTLNISKSKMGASGADAKLLSITSNRDYFAYDKEGVANPTNQTIAIKASLYNLTGTVSYSVGGFNTTGTRTTITLTPTGNNLNIPVATMASYVYLEVTASLTSGGVTYTDTKTISRVQDGSQAVVGWLTNESITVPASSTGSVSSADLSTINGTFKVFYGSTDVTSQSVFSYTRDDAKYTFAINSSGVYTISSLASGTDSFQIPVRATYNGKIVDKIVSIGKSKTGATGTSAYMWIMYAINSSGGSAVDVPPTANADAYKYIGIAVTSSPVKPAANSGSYTWTLYTGKDGVGKDGKSVHIKYSDDGGATFTANNGETPGKWLGLYVDTVYEDSSNPSDYTWNLAVQEALSPNPNLLPAGIASAYNRGSYTYDPITNIYTVTSVPRSDTWGSGISVNNTVVPYGESYRISGSFYCEREVDISVDMNNSRTGSSINDNDDHTGSRRSSSSPTDNIFQPIMRLPAGKWTTLWWGSKNAKSDNTGKLDITVYDSFGIRGNMITGNTTFKIRDLKLELGDKVTPYTSSKADLKGEDAIIATLTNDSYGAPSSSSGTVTAAGLTGATTTMKLYKGTSEITNFTGWTFTATIASGTGTYTLTANNLTVTGISTDTLTIRLTASHATYGSFIRDFSVTKVKQGVDGVYYTLDLSTLVVSKSPANTFSPAALTAKLKKVSGASSSYVSAKFQFLEYDINSTQLRDSGKLTATSSQNYAIANVNCKYLIVRAYDPAVDTNEWDYQTVYVVKDGIDSYSMDIKSDKGFIFSFDKDNLSVGVASITLSPNFSGPFTPSTYAWTKNGSAAGTSGVLTISSNDLKTATNILVGLTVTGSVNGVATTLTATTNVTKVKDGAENYLVQLSRETAQFPTNENGGLLGTLTNNTTTVRVFKGSTAVTPSITGLTTSGCTATYSGAIVTITGISADNGYVDIAVSADGKALGTTRFSFLKVRQGQSTKLYLAWADSADGTIGFSTTVAIDKKYMGTYTTTSDTQSTDPAVYKWIETSNAFTLGGRNYLLNSDFLDGTSYWSWSGPSDKVTGIVGEGENQWIGHKYSYPGSTRIYPSFDHIQGLTPIATQIFDDSTSFTFSDDYYIAHFQTNLYVNIDKQITTTVIHDDDLTIYCNDEVVVSKNTTIFTPYDITFNLKAGWNKIDILLHEIAGGDQVTFGAKLSSLVDHLSYSKDKVMRIDLSTSTATGSALYSNGWNSGFITAVKGDSLLMSGYTKVVSGAILNGLAIAEERSSPSTKTVVKTFTMNDTGVEWPNGKPTVGGDWKKFIIHYTVSNTSTNRVYFAFRNDTKSNVYFKLLKVEGGTVATEWSANPEDYYRRLDTVRTSANAANTAITEMASDAKLTGLEKLQVNKEVEIIKSEYPLLTSQADKYSITAEKTAYTSKYNTLISYITPLLSSLTTTSDIVAATFRNNFKDYYTAKTNLINAIYTTLNTRTSNTAQTTLVQLTNVVQDITGWSATVSEQYIRQATGGTNPQILSSLQSTIKNTARSIDLTVQDNGQLTPTGQSINNKYATINMTSDAIEFKVGGTTKASVKMTSGNVVFDFTNNSGVKQTTTVGGFMAWSWSPDGTDRFTTVFPKANFLVNTSFKNGLDNWSANDSWMIDTSVMRNGNPTVKGTFAGESPAWKSFSQTVSINGLSENDDVVWSAWVKSDSTVGELHFEIWGSVYFTRKNVGTEWTRVSLKGKLKSVLSVYIWNTKAGTYWISEPKLEKGTELTPYVPSPSDNYDQSIPRYIGYSAVDSSNPADYAWTSNPDRNAEVIGNGLAAGLTRNEFNEFKTSTFDPALNGKVDADDDYQTVKNNANAGKAGVEAITGDNGTLNKTVEAAKTELTTNLNTYKEEVKKFKFTSNITEISGNGISIRSAPEGDAKPKFAIDISSDKLSFKENDIEAAFITGKTFQITNGTITTVFQVGSHQFRKHDSNHTVIQWIKPS